MFPKELVAFQLDTALIASEEISNKALDCTANGSAEKIRKLISQSLNPDNE